MDMNMGDIDTHDSLSYLDAGTDFFEAYGHTLGKQLKLAKLFIRQVEDVIHLAFGNTQHMATNDRVDVEESKAMIGLCHTMAGNFA